MHQAPSMKIKITSFRKTALYLKRMCFVSVPKDGTWLHPENWRQVEELIFLNLEILTTSGRPRTNFSLWLNEPLRTLWKIQGAFNGNLGTLHILVVEINLNKKKKSLNNFFCLPFPVSWEILLSKATLFSSKEQCLSLPQMALVKGKSERYMGTIPTNRACTDE